MFVQKYNGVLSGPVPQTFQGRSTDGIDDAIMMKEIVTSKFQKLKNRRIQVFLFIFFE